MANSFHLARTTKLRLAHQISQAKEREKQREIANRPTDTKFVPNPDESTYLKMTFANGTQIHTSTGPGTAWIDTTRINFHYVNSTHVQVDETHTKFDRKTGVTTESRTSKVNRRD
jgi:hypothetical protein